MAVSGYFFRNFFNMTIFKKLFAPGADSFWTSIGLLVLRLLLGVTIFLNHGWGKLTQFGSLSATFPDPLGIGHTPSLVLAIFAEVICGMLLAVGLVTRLAALNLVVMMSVAFFLVHGAILTGPKSGELALIHLAGFSALLFSGGGRFSLDAKLFGSPQR